MWGVHTHAGTLACACGDTGLVVGAGSGFNAGLVQSQGSMQAWCRVRVQCRPGVGSGFNAGLGQSQGSMQAWCRVRVQCRPGAESGFNAGLV